MQLEMNICNASKRLSKRP